MRGSRSLLALLVIALGLGAYIYFVESKRDLTDPATKKEKVFAGLEPGKIEEIEVHSAAGEVTTLKKTGDTWQIVAPIVAPADQPAASAIVSALESLEMQRSLDDNPSSVEGFGVEPARITVAFKIAGDASQRRLAVGNKTPTGSDLYARVAGQPKLFLISAYQEDTFSRSTFDLRDKAVLSFARDAVDSVRLEAAGAQAVALVKKGSDWRLTTPLDTRADYTPVDSLISRASGLQAKSIVAGDRTPPTAAELKSFGLDTPQLVATFGAGSTQAKLAVGAKKDDATVYVRDLSRPLVFTTDASLLVDLKKSAADLRVKDIFAFKAYTARSLDITRAGSTFSMSRTPPPANADASAAEVWKATKPDPKDLNQTAVTDLLNTLSSLRAEKFEDRALSAGEEVVVVAKYGEPASPSEERVVFRRTGSIVHAIRTGESGAAVVPAPDFDKALTQLKDLTGGK